MPRKRTPDPSLLLFPAQDPTREEAEEIEAKIPVGSSLSLQLRFCQGACCKGKNPKGHGPYWFASVKSRQVYVGADGGDKHTRLLRAWAMLEPERREQRAKRDAEIEALEAAQAAELAQLKDKQRAERRRLEQTPKGGGTVVELHVRASQTTRRRSVHRSPVQRSPRASRAIDVRVFDCAKEAQK